MERSRIAVKISERLYIKIMQLDFLYFGEHTYGHSQKPFISAHSTQRSVILLAWKKEAPPVVQPEAAARRPSKTRSKKQKPQVDEAPRIYSEKVTYREFTCATGMWHDYSPHFAISFDI